MECGEGGEWSTVRGRVECGEGHEWSVVRGMSGVW